MCRRVVNTNTIISSSPIEGLLTKKNLSRFNSFKGLSLKDPKIYPPPLNMIVFNCGICYNWSEKWVLV